MFAMDLRILYLQYANPAAYPPVQHSAWLLAEKGWRIRVFGTWTHKTDRMRFPAHLDTEVVLLRYCPPGWRQKLHYLYYSVKALGWVLRWWPKWIYASDPLVSPIALALSFFPGVRVLYHEHDSPSLTSDLSSRQPVTPPQNDGGSACVGGSTSDLRLPTSWFQRLTLWSRTNLARRAELCILPNERRIEIFKKQTGRLGSVLCVWNCPRKDEIRPKKSKIKPDGILRLAFHGSINRDRLPLALLQAMSGFPGRVELSVVGFETVGAQGYMDEFQHQAAALGLADAVEFVGALPTRDDIFQQASKCDVGVAFMPARGGDVNMVNMTGASNKPFDYLACGLALLVSDLPDWRTMFVDPGYGLACQPEDENSIAAQLHWCLDHPGETREMGERGRLRIASDWNYQKQFASAFEII